MPRWRRTWRDADGVRVEGTWRHIFTRNAGMYYLNDLVIYADGAVECRIGGLTNLDGLREAFQRGTVATTLEEGEYFRNRDIADAEWEARVPADGPETAQAATLTLYQTVYPKGWPADPGVKVLQNDLPATISVEGREYPSVTHAYRALSTSDSDRHDRIAAAARAYDAAKVAEQAPRRANWAAARLAVMAKLLRAKYTQHPQLAQTLLATADAHIIYTGLDSAYWIAPRHQLDRPPARSDPLRTVRRGHAPPTHHSDPSASG